MIYMGSVVYAEKKEMNQQKMLIVLLAQELSNEHARWWCNNPGRSKSSLVAEFKEKQDSDPKLLQFEDVAHRHK